MVPPASALTTPAAYPVCPPHGIAFSSLDCHMDSWLLAFTQDFLQPETPCFTPHTHTNFSSSGKPSPIPSTVLLTWVRVPWARSCQSTYHTQLSISNTSQRVSCSLSLSLVPNVCPTTWKVLTKCQMVTWKREIKSCHVRMPKRRRRGHCLLRGSRPFPKDLVHSL